MPSATVEALSSRLLIHNLTDGDGRDRRSSANSFAEDVRRGLTGRPKRLFPKYFYDEIGSLLFDVICLLPEYYLTRAEAEIFERFADEMIAQARRQKGPGGSGRLTLIEMGSGSAQKTRTIIETLLRGQSELRYVPVDISPSALETSARLLLEAYPSLSVEAYAGDYESALRRLREAPAAGEQRLILFLGSNIGNFDAGGALSFLRSLRAILQPGDALLLGADLKKDAAVLEAAYDDPLGVTASFNLNQLVRINRELGANFAVREFKHVARYREDAGRVEMCLESRSAQRVRLDRLDLDVEFAAGELIHTENSHKYDLAQLAELAAAANFELQRTWFDAGRKFSSNLLVAGADAAA